MKIKESQLRNIVKESILEMLGEKANSGEPQTPHVVRTLSNNYSVVCIRCRNGKFKMNIMDPNGQLLSKYWFDAVGKDWENGFGKNGTYTSIRVKLGYRWLRLTNKGELINIPRMPSAKPLEGPETEDWWLGGGSDPIFENRLKTSIKESIKKVLNERNNRPFPEYAKEYMEKNGKKLPDEVLTNAAEKNSERFFSRNSVDGKYQYKPQGKNYERQMHNKKWSKPKALTL